MSEKLNRNFSNWINRLSKEWNLPIEFVVSSLGNEEIENRLNLYPQLREVLRNPDFSIENFSDIISQCWAYGGRYENIRFKGIEKEVSKNLIRALINDFPENKKDIIERISGFIESIVFNGYVNENQNPDRSGAALLCSVILTSCFPKMFVDFRQSRWKTLAKIMEYDISYPTNSHAEGLLWAGKFAEDLANTDSFKAYWSGENPLWTIAGISWVCSAPNPPGVQDDDSMNSFPEGAKKQKLHEYRERNSELVKKAKEIGLAKDPSLPCEVCGFSYVKKYGLIGEGFIEAHHKKPVADLKPGDKTLIKDIALVCGNCHRMIHSGKSHTLSIEEIKAQLK